MDNSVLPYEISQSSDESDDSDSSSDNGMLISDNIGIHNQPNKNINQQYFLNMENTQEYQIKRNKLFTPEITKHRIVIESKSLDHATQRNTSNYIARFSNYNQAVNQNNQDNINSYYNYDNVIGFKFIKSFVPQSTYQVNDNNNTFQIEFENPVTNPPTVYERDIQTITLDNGYYNFTELGNHLLNKLSNITPSNPAQGQTFAFTVTDDPVSFKYNITNSGTRFKFLMGSSYGYSWRLFGFFNSDTEFKLTHISDNIPQHSTHFVDLVIPEIPFIACKHNNLRKHLIERIPLGSPGEIKEYVDNDNLDNYFYPIKLSKLTIQLYEDSTDMFYQCQNADNSFEFEITILNRNVNL